MLKLVIGGDMSTLPNYEAFYNRTIQEHSTGLKNTPGGTGNGKTSAIPSVVQADTTGRKFLYVPNRVQLLEEMAKKLTDANVPFVHLQRDTDLVIQLLQSHERRADLEDL